MVAHNLRRSPTTNYKHRREGREVFFFGDFNAYTGISAGWDGSDSLLASDHTPNRRRSDCTGTLNERGRDLIHLAQLNGFVFLFFSFFFLMRAPRVGDPPMGGSPPVRAPGRTLH